MNNNLVVFQKAYDCYLYLHNALKHFPKSEKFVLAADIKNTFFEMLKLFLIANKSRYKKKILYEADVQLDILRFRIRAAHNLQFLKTKQYEQVFNVKRGIDFLGYRQFPNRLILRKRVLKKNYKKFKKLSRTADAQKIERSLASFEGLCKHCSSKKILNDVYKILGEHQNGNRHIHHSEQPSAT